MAEVRSPALGSLAKCVVGLEETFGIPVVGTQVHPLLSENLTDDPTFLIDNTLSGRGGRRQPDLGVRPTKGDIVLRWRYFAHDLFLEQWFGRYFAGNYFPILTTFGQGLTIAFEKHQSVWEFSGCKIAKLVFAATPAEVKLTVSVHATYVTRSSIVNTHDSLRAIPFNVSPNVLFTDARIRFGERGRPLDESTDHGVTDYTLTLDRPMDEVFTNQSRFPIEALENNLRTCSFNFKVPRYETDKFYAWRDNVERLQAEVFHQSGDFSKKFLLPEMTLTAVKSSIAGPAAIPLDVTTSISEGEDSLTGTGISASEDDNSVNIESIPATGELTMSGGVVDGETVTIGADTYEVDTKPGELGAYDSSNIRLNLSRGSTKQAKGTLTISAQPEPDDSMTIDESDYTFQTNGELTNVIGNIEIGATLVQTRTNIVNAVNRTGNPGHGYAAATVKHPSVIMADFVAVATVLTARQGGTAGNDIATTSDFTSSGNHFSGATLGAQQLGVDPPPAEFLTAFIAAVNDVGTEPVLASIGETPVAASGSIGTDGTNLTDGNTIVIDGKTYTFKETALTPAEGEVLVAGSADGTALNLAHAINKAGGSPATDYSVAAPHSTVSASTTIASNRFTITAKTAGTAGNSIPLDKTGTHTSINGKTTLEDGVDGSAIVTATTPGLGGNSIATTETLANGEFADTTLVDGDGLDEGFAYALPYSDVFISGFATGGNNGTAPLIEWSPTKLILASAADGGINLVDEDIGANVTVTIRSFDVMLVETSA